MLAYPAIPVIKSKYTTYETGTAIDVIVNSDGSIKLFEGVEVKVEEAAEGTESSYDNKVKNIKTHSYDFDQYVFGEFTAS